MSVFFVRAWWAHCKISLFDKKCLSSQKKLQEVFSTAQYLYIPRKCNFDCNLCLEVNKLKQLLEFNVCKKRTFWSCFIRSVATFHLRAIWVWRFGIVDWKETFSAFTIQTLGFSTSQKTPEAMSTLQDNA